MSTIIMDLCSYTRLGLTGYLASRGVRKRDINDAHTVDELAAACDELKPGVVDSIGQRNSYVKTWGCG
ncbi:hypothetical protein DJ544_24070, partial [Enterobacter roggenkampii]